MKRTKALICWLAAILLLANCDDQADDCVGDECLEEEEPEFCGDGICSDDENFNLCPDDCVAICGDGICNGWEHEFNCPRDCGSPPLCGDNICEYTRGEDDQNCFEDCSCWNGQCDSDRGETELTCYQDCGECGNGVCSGPEDQWFCPEDCPRPLECGDLICELGETAETCPDDCHCGWDTCDLDETPETCPEDCPVTCGDDVCDDSIGEDWLRCPTDCRFCNDPDYPVDCDDDSGCWPIGTNCRSRTFYCDDASYRCGWTNYRANCCEDIFHSCPENRPYFCSADDECYTLDVFETECSSRDSCTLLNLPCS
ncbi:hypothetical protein KKF05_02510 [Patescibacteria group bacterium]|nr:hypothetical protein [Patescibacteria group bacterium]MBU1915722.1 hypothetical protein [Patescibacteria group bacterium]